MTTANAIRIAMKNEVFRQHHEMVLRYAEKQTINSPCLTFVVDDEYFYYGFDGCEIKKGKYRPHIADIYRKQNFGLVIR